MGGGDSSLVAVTGPFSPPFHVLHVFHFPPSKVPIFYCTYIFLGGWRHGSVFFSLGVVPLGEREIYLPLSHFSPSGRLAFSPNYRCSISVILILVQLFLLPLPVHLFVRPFMQHFELRFTL